MKTIMELMGLRNFIRDNYIYPYDDTIRFNDGKDLVWHERYVVLDVLIKKAWDEFDSQHSHLMITAGYEVKKEKERMIEAYKN